MLGDFNTFPTGRVYPLCHDIRIWDQCVNGIYLSDHYPVEVTCEL